MSPTPKTSSTRAQLPVGLSGAEPPNAPEGGLAYATDTEVVRVKTSTGWEDVGGGGGGTITEIDAGTGIAVTAGTGPIVTVATDLAAGTGISITGTHPQTIATTGAPPTGSASGDLSGSYPGPNVAAIHETSGPTKLTIGSVANGELLRRVSSTLVGVGAGSLSIAGQVTGTLASTTVVAVTETGGPTALTIGSIANNQYVVRSGSTLVGTSSSPPTGSAGGDLSGTYPNPNVAAIHETSGPTQLTIGAIADGRLGGRQGSTFVGIPQAYYLRLPASPNAFNFEAASASTADLATLGFTFRRVTATAGTMVRRGDIYASRGLGTFSALGPLEYLSSLIDGRLYLQLPTSASDILYTCTKSINVPTTTTSYGALLWSRFTPVATYAPSGFSSFGLIGIFKNSSGNADTANYVGTYSYCTTNLQRGVEQGVGGSVSDNNSTISALRADLEDIKTIRVQATVTNLSYLGGFSSSSTGGEYQQFQGTPALGVASGLTHAGFLLRPGTNSPTAAAYTSYDYVIDYARLYTGDLSGQWIGNQ